MRWPEKEASKKKQKSVSDAQNGDCSMLAKKKKLKRKDKQKVFVWKTVQENLENLWSLQKRKLVISAHTFLDTSSRCWKLEGIECLLLKFWVHFVYFCSKKFLLHLSKMLRVFFVSNDNSDVRTKYLATVCTSGRVRQPHRLRPENCDWLLKPVLSVMIVVCLAKTTHNNQLFLSLHKTGLSANWLYATNFNQRHNSIYFKGQCYLGCKVMSHN